MSEYDSLIAAARRARENAHARFSNFKVGAGLRAKSGKIYGGCNVENATYGLTVCAERVAIFKAMSEGERDDTGRRLAAFYADHLKAHPEWRITPDSSLVSATRNMLVTQMGLASADDTVYHPPTPPSL